MKSSTTVRRKHSIAFPVKLFSLADAIRQGTHQKHHQGKKKTSLDSAASRS
jgi:hypothetical protein